MLSTKRNLKNFAQAKMAIDLMHITWGIDQPGRPQNHLSEVYGMQPSTIDSMCNDRPVSVETMTPKHPRGTVTRARIN
jgi:hypothetical protein